MVDRHKLDGDALEEEFKVVGSAMTLFLVLSSLPI